MIFAIKQLDLESIQLINESVSLIGMLHESMLSGKRILFDFCDNLP